MTTQNKIALVTGGGRGLGKEMALELAKRGQDVIITYYSKKEEAELVVKAGLILDVPLTEPAELGVEPAFDSVAGLDFDVSEVVVESGETSLI